MDRKEIIEGIKKLRANAEKRKFSQGVDLILNLKELDLKKETDKVNSFITLPHTLGKRVKIGALVGEALSTKAKESCDRVILVDEFKKLDKKTVRKLAKEIDYFIAQADIMPQVASTFGKVLGPRGKVPNPKAGCVLPPTAEVRPVVERLQKTVRVQTKNEPTIKVRVGSEVAKDEELVENIHALYVGVLAVLPQEKNNIKSVVVKLTMGKPVYLEEKKIQGETK